jgi:hypothetical protein
MTLARRTAGIAIAALLGLAVVGPLASPAAAAPDATAPALAAPAVEVDIAVAGTPPSSLPCTEDYFWVKACWQPSDDLIWVLNLDTPYNANVYWWNYYPTDGTVYRQGRCVNTMADGVWGYCNKNMHENSKVSFRACDDSTQYRICSAIKDART